jgi:hypothetical protein
MTRFVRLFILLCLAAPITTRGADAGELNYGLYVLGVPLADVMLSIDLASPAYRIGLHYHTIGLASLVAGDRMDTSTSGVLDGDRPEPLEYESIGKLHGRDRVVGLAWRNGTPIVTSLSPSNDAEREDVPASLRARTIDPWSVIILLVEQATTTGRCEGNARTYDGRRLEAFEARTAGEDELTPSMHSSFRGRALRCDFTDQALAGFRFGPGRDDDQRVRRGTVWLAPVLPGTQRLPVRASLETRLLGDAMIYLTSTTP